MNLKLFFNGFVQLYYYWEVLVIVSLFAVVLNSFYSIVSKKIFTFFDLRITIFALVFNHVFFVIGVLIYLFNLLSLFLVYEQEYMIDQNNDLFFLTPHLINLLSTIIITVGWSLHKKSDIDYKKVLRLFVFYFSGLAILIVKYLYLI
jgi:hypothetical protein|tara:strand:+ start:1500 stop:1940 length:441 start_codon:yes stop_codon:yes gene_type:complete